MEKSIIISEIAAVCSNRGIGKDNDLLFKIPEDLKHFKDITKDHAVIMGYNTFLSLGKPLPNRVNIVLSSKRNLEIEGCIIVGSIKDALMEAEKVEKYEIFIIGGANIYQQFIFYADKLYLTLINAEPDADTFFPDYSNFKVIKESKEFSYKNIKYRFAELISSRESK